MFKFYNKKEIDAKAQKYYSSGKIFRDYIKSASLFPLTITLKKLKQSDLSSHYSTIVKEIDILKKEDFELQYRMFNFKSIGMQRLPVSVYFSQRNSFLSYLKKEDEFVKFKDTFEKIISYDQMLLEVIYEKVSLVLEYEDVWDRLFYKGVEAF